MPVHGLCSRASCAFHQHAVVQMSTESGLLPCCTQLLQCCTHLLQNVFDVYVSVYKNCPCSRAKGRCVLRQLHCSCPRDRDDFQDKYIFGKLATLQSWENIVWRNVMNIVSEGEEGSESSDDASLCNYAWTRRKSLLQPIIR